MVLNLGSLECPGFPGSSYHFFSPWGFNLSHAKHKLYHWAMCQPDLYFYFVCFLHLKLNLGRPEKVNSESSLYSPAAAGTVMFSGRPKGEATCSE
jgi:hypothetical protein